MTARRTGAASAAALLALGLALAALGVDASLGADARDEVRRHEADASALEAQRVRALREGEASGRAAARVIAGTLPLAGAVDELEPLLRQRTGFECAWTDEPFPTFRHRVARYVVIRVAAELKHDPDRRAAVLARLDAEYATLR
ncbi:hypothetical protein [Gemmata sp.]|uniref:hypothetical protein n=1 Tax=Gemmata sp. TaxID=1914242 RepID=UPI003F71DB92